MNIKLLKDCLIAGQHCSHGDVVDVSDRDGAYLIGTHAAERAGKAGKVKKTTVKTLAIIMTHACMVGGNHVAPGDAIAALQPDANFLFAHGYALKAGTDEAKAFKAKLKAEAAAQAEAEAEAQAKAEAQVET